MLELWGFSTYVLKFSSHWEILENIFLDINIVLVKYIPRQSIHFRGLYQVSVFIKNKQTNKDLSSINGRW